MSVQTHNSEEHKCSAESSSFSYFPHKGSWWLCMSNSKHEKRLHKMSSRDSSEVFWIHVWGVSYTEYN